MKVGDLIMHESTRTPVVDDDERYMGTILRLDRYSGRDDQRILPFPDHGQQIIEVLWNTSHIGWIAASRVEVISESR